MEFSSVSLIGGLKGGPPPKFDRISVALGTRTPKSGVPAEEAVVGGLMDRRFGALDFAMIFRSLPKRSANPSVVGDGEFCARSGVRVPKVRCRVSVSIRDSADDCCSWRSLLRPDSYSRLVRVTLLSTAGVEFVDGCQSFKDGARWEVIEVAAVEFLARDGTEDRVDDVSRL